MKTNKETKQHRLCFPYNIFSITFTKSFQIFWKRGSIFSCSFYLHTLYHSLGVLIASPLYELKQTDVTKYVQVFIFHSLLNPSLENIIFDNTYIKLNAY